LLEIEYLEKYHLAHVWLEAYIDCDDTRYFSDWSGELKRYG
jgi:hypothetical protein